ncbi:glycoside hydrolase family 31 protein [Egbenema bharatensis]|uniref:glycoside hydrolase family 31 protein n=1 Tax=Egbenema bharatensis TaxID=3463334 RepID=UPI003A89C0CB
MPQYFGKLPTAGQEWTTLGNVQSAQWDEPSLVCQCGEATLLLTVLDHNLIRVQVAPTGAFAAQRSWAVTKPDQEWAIVPVQFQEDSETITLKTEVMRVQIQRSPCRISCFDHAGNPFAQDAEMGVGWSASGIAAWKQIESDEHFYGFGERTGLLDKRSEEMTNWTVDSVDYSSQTDEMYQAIPFFTALRPGLSYGIFLHSTYWSRFNMGAEQPGVWQMHTRAPELDYYILYGSEPAQILKTYTELTGRMPLPPKWALGYHQCRWSYESEEVVEALAQEFRNRRIPCDVIHLDIDYMQGYRVFTWHEKRFPDPKALGRHLNQNGFQLVTIVDPGVKHDPEAGYAIYDEGCQKDYFVRKPDGKLFHGYVWPDKSVFPDFMRPEVREWWSDCHTALTDAGVAGIWNDMNEPSISDRPFGDGGNKIPFPLDATQGPADEPATHAETHNLYGYMMARAAREAMEKHRPHQRSFVLTRSGFAGIQRWSSVWLGDNTSLWDQLEMSLPMLCNMGLSGVAFVGCDIGGFAGNATAEMFARWMQVGLLYPLMRAHSAMTTNQHEPWCFGDRIEQICREYIELRYQLLPYFYSLFWEATQTGAPILRPLLYHYPNDPKTYSLHDQVLLGEWLMAAPIYHPGQEYRAVYLPEGTWYDWWSNERFEGPTHILTHAPLERMPLYAKAGAIIPMQLVMQYVNQHPVEELTLRVYPGEGQNILYEDDGDSFDYQSGAWRTTTYQVRQEGDRVIVEAIDRQGNWNPGDRTVRVDLQGRSDLEVDFRD